MMKWKKETWHDQFEEKTAYVIRQQTTGQYPYLIAEATRFASAWKWTVYGNDDRNTMHSETAPTLREAKRRAEAFIRRYKIKVT